MRERYAIFTAPETVRDAIVSIFEAYRNEHAEYPTSHVIDALARVHPIIPTMRTIQLHGGIRHFYETLLGLPYVNASTGDRRGAYARAANLRAFGEEYTFSKALANIFGESNVHHRSPYPGQTDTWISTDFKVYTSRTKFFCVDIFSASGIMNLAGCVNIKVAKLERAKVPMTYPIFFVSCNDSTSQGQIEEYVKAKKKPLPKNIELMDINTAIERFKQMAPIS